MPVAEPLLLAGSVAGIAGLTFLSFTAVSYLEVKRKIDEQIARGEDPYELQVQKRVEQRAQPPAKRGGGSKKRGGGKRK
ncbi:hypothetical protein ABPG77_010563 [Micractinium sp. CCAP 211/92]